MRSRVVGFLSIVVSASLCLPSVAIAWSTPGFAVTYDGSTIDAAPQHMPRPLVDPFGIGVDFTEAWGVSREEADLAVGGVANTATLKSMNVTTRYATSTVGSPYYLNVDGECFAYVELVSMFNVVTQCSGFPYARQQMVASNLNVKNGSNATIIDWGRRSYGSYDQGVGRVQALSSPGSESVVDDNPEESGGNIGSLMVGRYIAAYREGGTVYYRIGWSGKHAAGSPDDSKEFADETSGTVSALYLGASSHTGPTQLTLRVWDESDLEYQVPGLLEADDDEINVRHSAVGWSALTTDVAEVKALVNGSVQPEFDLDKMAAFTGENVAALPSTVTSDTVEAILEGSPFASMLPDWAVGASDWLVSKIRGLADSVFGGLFWWADEMAEG